MFEYLYQELIFLLLFSQKLPYLFASFCFPVQSILSSLWPHFLWWMTVPCKVRNSARLQENFIALLDEGQYQPGQRHPSQCENILSFPFPLQSEFGICSISYNHLLVICLEENLSNSFQNTMVSSANCLSSWCHFIHLWYYFSLSLLLHSHNIEKSVNLSALFFAFFFFLNFFSRITKLVCFVSSDHSYL